MWNISKILSPELTVCNLSGDINKKQLLEKISLIAHEVDHSIRYQDVLSTLQQREKLGSTAIGHGVAIPHGRVAALEHPMCVLISLDKAIEFDPSEPIAVDLIFGLLVPEDAEEEHLQILATLANQLKSESYRERLRAAKTNDELYHAATSSNE